MLPFVMKLSGRGFLKTAALKKKRKHVESGLKGGAIWVAVKIMVPIIRVPKGTIILTTTHIGDSTEFRV